MHATLPRNLPSRWQLFINLATALTYFCSTAFAHYYRLFVFFECRDVDLVFERDERLSSYLLRPLREEGTTIVVCVRKQVPLPPTALPILPV